MRTLCIPVNGSRLLRLLNVYYANAAPVIYGVAGGNGGRRGTRHSRRQRRRNGGLQAEESSRDIYDAPYRARGWLARRDSSRGGGSREGDGG